MPLTPEEKQRYVKEAYGHCPFCHSGEIEGDRIDMEGDTCAQRVSCLDCGKRWDDIYTLTDVEEVTDG